MNKFFETIALTKARMALLKETHRQPILQAYSDGLLTEDAAKHRLMMAFHTREEAEQLLKELTS